MKKIIAAILCLVLVLGFSACSKSEEEDLDTITIPASSFGANATDEQKKASYNNIDVEEMKVNSDGSLAIIMTPAQRQKVLSDLKTAFDSVMANTIASKDAVITKYEVDSGFTHFKIYINQSTIPVSESNNILVFYSYGINYQLFNKVQSDDIDVKVTYYDDATGNEINSSSYNNRVSETTTAATTTTTAPTTTTTEAPTTIKVETTTTTKAAATTTTTKAAKAK